MHGGHPPSLLFRGLAACMGTKAFRAMAWLLIASTAFGGFLYSRWAQDVRRPRITQHFQGQRHVLLVVISVSHIILSSLEAKLRQKWSLSLAPAGNDVKLGAISLTLKLVESRLSCALNLEREDCQNPKHILF